MPKMNGQFQPDPTNQGHRPTVQDGGTLTDISVSKQYRDPPHLLSRKTFEVLSLLIVSTVIGKFGMYLVVAALLQFWQIKVLESHKNDVAEIMEKATRNILQAAGQEKLKLDVMGAEAKKRRSKDVATTTSCTMEQLLRMQVEQ